MLPGGSDKKGPALIRKLDGVAVMAIGTLDDGPWRIVVSPDPWTQHKNLQRGNSAPLVAGAMLWFRNEKSARDVAARAGATFARIQQEQRMPLAWFVMAAGDVQRILEKSAQLERAEFWSAQAWAAQAEAKR